MAYPKDGSIVYILNVGTKTAMTLYNDGQHSVTKPVLGYQWFLQRERELPFNTLASQQWNVKYTVVDHNDRQYVTLQNVLTGRYLDVNSDPDKNSVPVVGNAPSKGFNQEWYFTLEGTNRGDPNLHTYSSYNPGSDKYDFSLDLNGANGGDGALITTWNDASGNINQTWAFITAPK